MQRPMKVSGCGLSINIHTEATIAIEIIYGVNIIPKSDDAISNRNIKFLNTNNNSIYLLLGEGQLVRTVLLFLTIILNS